MSNTKKPGFGRLLAFAGQKKWHLILSAILAAASALCALIPYMLIYLVITKLLDPSFGQKDYQSVQKFAFMAFAGVIVRYLLFFVSNMFSHIAAFNILYGLRSALAKHLGKLHMGYFTENRTGGIKKILSEDVEEIEQFIAHNIPDIVSGLTLPVITIIYLFTIDWKMACVTLTPLPFALILQYYAFGSTNRDSLMKKYHDSLETMNGTIVEYVKGMPVVKIFNQSVDSYSRLKQVVYAFRDFVNQWTEKAAPPWAAFTVITSSSLFVILPFGIWFYMHGSLSLPTLLLFLMLGAGYMIPLLKVASMGGNLSRILEGVGRIDKVLSQPAICESLNCKSPENYSIEFKNVGFGYGKTKVLKDTSFIIDQGMVTALVGPSGAGKSTIAQLLLRMWEVDEGKIMIGGVNIKDISSKELMNLIGFVFQDIFIFSDTIYENIRMGMENVTEEAVIKAAKASQCFDFINSLPNGFNSLIGEGGQVHLSGGEKQRISLARIFLKDAPIIVLDEATAYADAENESKIQTAFATIMKGKTVIVIAHRLSTIVDADRIFVINQGKVAEKGSHEILLEKGTLYSLMWKAHTDSKNWTFDIEGAELC